MGIGPRRLLSVQVQTVGGEPYVIAPLLGTAIAPQSRRRRRRRCADRVKVPCKVVAMTELAISRIIIAPQMAGVGSVTWLALDLARYYGGPMGFYIVGLSLLLFAFVSLSWLRNDVF
jgi:hypothetical protein